VINYCTHIYSNVAAHLFFAGAIFQYWYLFLKGIFKYIEQCNKLFTCHSKVIKEFALVFSQFIKRCIKCTGTKLSGYHWMHSECLSCPFFLNCNIRANTSGYNLTGDFWAHEVGSSWASYWVHWIGIETSWHCESCLEGPVL